MKNFLSFFSSGANKQQEYSKKSHTHKHTRTQRERERERERETEAVVVIHPKNQPLTPRSNFEADILREVGHGR